MRRWLAAAASAALLTAAPAARAGQDWRASSLASFDDVWQTIHDTYFDPTFGGLDWAAVRTELRPKAEAAGSVDDVRRVIKEMLSRLKLSHFELLPSTAMADETVSGDAIPPIDLRVTTSALEGWPDGSAFIVTRVDPSARGSGLRVGDVVSGIGGAEVSRWAAALASIDDARARRLELWKKAVRSLYGAEGSSIELTVGLAGSTRTVLLRRAKEPGDVVKLGNLPPLHVRVAASLVRTPGRRQVGVIGFNYWMTAIDAPFAAAVDRFRKADGLVIDLRGNPGGLAGMIRGIAGHFFAEPVLLGTSRTRDAELEFTANPRLATADGRRVKPFAGPVAILVDELTGSASECFAAAMQSLGRARIIGRQTMGQALPASTKRLPDGDVLLYAIGDFLTATGRRVEAAGVTPDEVVPLTPEAFAATRDPVLAAALQWFDR